MIVQSLSKNQTGQALIEALLALTFAVVIITAVVIAVITSLSSATFTKNQNQASNYAQEGLDVARNMKESDPQTFFGLNGNYCANMGISLTGSGNCTVGIYTQNVFVDDIASRCAAGKGSFVISTVSWNDGKCQNSGDKCHKVQLDSCFYNLNSVPNP